MRVRGFSYLGVIFIVGLLSLTGAMASVVVATEQRRENERQLMFVGREFQSALQRYQQRLPQHPKRHPSRLEELLRDDRGSTLERHLRRIHIDPMTGRAEWGLIRRPDGGIVGVHSLSEQTAFERRRIGPDDEAPPGRRYREWLFVAPAASAPAQE